MQIVTSKGQIQYSVISDATIHYSDIFFHDVLNLLKTFPKDLLQLNSTWNFFNFNRDLLFNQGISLFTLPTALFSDNIVENKEKFQYYSNIWNIGIIKVFLVDARVNNHLCIAETIKLIPHSYVRLFGHVNDTSIIDYYGSERLFKNAKDLIELIKNNSQAAIDEIKETYDVDLGKLELNAKNSRPDFNPYYPSNINEPNFYILNSILANYWMDGTSIEKDVKIIPSEKRVGWMLSQSKVIDNLHQYAKKTKNDTKLAPTPTFPPLILIAPYHFPKIDKVTTFELPLDKKTKVALQISQSEQNKDYSFIINEAHQKYYKKEQIAQIIQIIHQKLTFLDHVACLHAHLTYSPVIRLPLIGRSLNNDLSHFEQTFSTKKKAVEKITKVGKLLKDLLIDDSIGKYISQRNGQIIAVTDLPLEWMVIDKYPLCFTHDVCRIPEYNQASLVNNYIHNQRLNYVIQPNLVANTLILHCASDDDINMQNMFKLVDNCKESLGFKSERCSTIDDVKAAIAKHKPELLIFDCHGNADKDSLSSYLILDGKQGNYLTGEDIIQHQISAPLVFISACSTMPTYGYVKFLSDAFFQAGAFAVTATFLPIEMLNAATINIRLLSKLKQLNQGIFHSNWLEFIAHLLRTVLIHETAQRARDKFGDRISIDHKKIAEFLVETMIFQKRVDAFDNLRGYFQSLDPSFRLDYNDLNHEWLSYTTIGRADLIYFKNWLQDFQLRNYGEVPNSTLKNN